MCIPKMHPPVFKRKSRVQVVEDDQVLDEHLRFQPFVRPFHVAMELTRRDPVFNLPHLHLTAHHIDLLVQRLNHQLHAHLPQTDDEQMPDLEADPIEPPFVSWREFSEMYLEFRDIMDFNVQIFGN